MRLIRYLRQPCVVITHDCCVHLDDSTELERMDADVAVWLESYVPERMLLMARRLRRPVLNSLWLSEPHLSAYRDHLGLFREIVLVPYKPGASVQRYEDNLSELLKEMNRCGVPCDKLIVDLAILPYGREPDTAVYRSRLDELSAKGLRTVAAFDNFIHRAPGKRELLTRLRMALEDKLTYALITERFAGELRRD
ncbi:hypothetical protein SD70_12275 [Gordoniibacillus kamchatkensis]|uniref:Uncharacterized protein n=1 Tax=Gordoniibacillus kamchatkensis TaxID=1590651 RepID=A0ABR5AK05_9BACL|nr:hypothetical protein [Paenibacillus sp. VKM B-2647]KIL40677.1 hypothetical protein SD70_12275 [Paenibacillus sp. VKM B-2647]